MSNGNGIHLDVPENDYFTLEAMSASRLNTLLNSPARFAWQQENPPEATDVADFGSVVHTLLLGGPEFQVIDAPDWRSSKVREQRDALRAAGHTVILGKDYERAEAAAAAVMRHPVAAALLSAEGDSEVTLRWDKAVEHAVVPMKGRVDRVSVDADGVVTLVDVKTTASAAPLAFAGSVFRYGYAVQQAVYRDGWRDATGESPEFVFLVVEKEPPFITAVYRLDWAGVAKGEADYERALRLYVECSTTDEWPGYPDGVLSSPGWVKHEARESGVVPADEAGMGLDVDAAW